MSLFDISQLPQPIQEIIIGGTAGLATEMTNRLIGAAGYAVKKRFQSEPQQLALSQCIEEALELTIGRLTSDSVHIEHLLTLFDEWTQQEAVQGELSLVIAPFSEAEIDIQLLREEFESIYDPDLLGDSMEFEQIVSYFTAAFANAAATKPVLQGQIQIQLLRDIAQRIQGVHCHLSAGSDLADIQMDYLRDIIQRSEYVSFRGMNIRRSNANPNEEQQRLADIYIQLQVNQRDSESSKLARPGQREEEQSLTAVDAFIFNRQMILLGEPGSGKSTFVHYLSFCLAAHHLESNQKWIDRLGEWPESWHTLIPVPIVLREMAAWMASEKNSKRQVGLLQDYLHYQLANRGLEAFYAHLCQQLKDGKALLLLDGLDEIPADSGVLEDIKELIAYLPTAYADTPIVITCRVRSYEDSRWQISDLSWPALTLAALNEEQVDTFITTWYQQLGIKNLVQNPSLWSESLSRAVRRVDLWRLARNPLLLTMMAMVHHTNEGRLPDERAVLYEWVIDLLLTYWEAAKIETPEGESLTWQALLKRASVNNIELKQALWKLAFQAHGKMPVDHDGEATADIPRAELRDALAELNRQNTFAWADRVMEMIKLRAGLLREDDYHVYRFPHRTFQEYLAACHLSEDDEINFEQSALALANQGAFWREVILLAVGRFVHIRGKKSYPLLLISTLCPKRRPKHSDILGWQNITLASECLLEMGIEQAKKHDLGLELVPRVRKRLTYLITHNLLSPKQRAVAGSVLSVLGDKRKNLAEMILIPEGKFLMGSSEQSSLSMDREKPQHTAWVSEFWISKYPVTNAQYAQFISVNPEQEPPSHWVERTPPLELLNHPVVYVSWYDAQTYCNWLSQERAQWLQEKGLQLFRLPTEAEWEKAARGTNGHIYPWGNRWDSTFCNMRATGIDKTSSIGIFTKSKSPYGCMDMAGNVWEWAADWYDERIYTNAQEKDPTGPKKGKDRVLRGGSFHDVQSGIRCAVRLYDFPRNRSYGVGMRVVAVGS